jgi:hypothetical protein
MRVGYRVLLPLVGSALGLTLGACSASDLNLPSDGAPAKLTAVSGDGQEATVGSTLPKPLVVLVTDAVRRPVPGVPLIFRFQDEFPDAEIDPATVQTDSSGLALVRVRLGSTAGSQTIEAVFDQESASGSRALFEVTALQMRGNHDGSGDGSNDPTNGKQKGRHKHGE